MKREPVLLTFLVAAIPLVTAFVLQVLHDGDVNVPHWLIALLAGVGPLIAALGALYARSQVTPTADPRDDRGTPLVPR